MTNSNRCKVTFVRDETPDDEADKRIEAFFRALAQSHMRRYGKKVRDNISQPEQERVYAPNQRQR